VRTTILIPESGPAGNRNLLTTGALMGAVTGGLDGFREAQILLRRGSGDDTQTLTLPRDRALSGSAGHVLRPGPCVLPSGGNSVAAPDPGSGRTYFLVVN